MYRVPVQIPGPLRIYISATGFNRISEQQQRFSYLPDANRLVTDLMKLGSQGGIPAFQKQTQQIARWRQKQEQSARKADQKVLGFFYRWRVHFFQKRLLQLYPLVTEVQRSQEAVRQEHQVAQQQLQEALEHDPEYSQYTNTITTLSVQSSHFLEQVQKHALEFARQTNGLLPHFTGAITGVDLRHHLSQIATHFTLLEQRATLLHNWQNELETSAEQLTPEVLRYADIVGATCIGVATAKGLADIDFDLVIVDEAGQISTPNLLVPLVRARRAILVGDHMQLPPFVDSNVKTWIENLSTQALQDLGVEYEDFEQNQLLSALTRSAFEQLLLAQPRRNNLVAFTEQRRMPEVIAGFASQHFYSRQLTTVRNTQSSVRDTFFRSELAFIDTSTLDKRERQDARREKTEDWESPGFINQCEARVIARLAARYEQNKAEWAIIVPYRAQASLIISYLEKLIEAPDFRWDERVATVDSFQGGERDYILYSFTRSNSYGNIGFLNELRRFNVALTRARQQMVLVGDLITLTHAEDPDFGALIQSLQSYVQKHGELLTYQECQRRLG